LVRGSGVIQCSRIVLRPLRWGGTDGSYYLDWHSDGEPQPESYREFLELLLSPVNYLLQLPNKPNTTDEPE
jgi:hypothetical protein